MRTQMQRPKPKGKPGPVKRALQATRVWASKQTGCPTCNKIRGATAAIVGPPTTK
jgi:hypothetical protein